MSKYYLTTPIYYVNARPHIGHAYTTIVADVLARRHRLLGDDTFFLTGTDEHGQKIERSAAAAGVPPQQFADEVSASFENLWKRMGITHDRYIRTTDAKHQQGVQHLFSALYEKGYIYLDSYTGAYCVSDETFVDVPAGAPCPDCGRITETVTEENFFFKLSAFQLKLLDLIESGELKIENDARRNEVLSFLRGNVAAAAQANLAGEVVAEQRDILASAANFSATPSTEIDPGTSTASAGQAISRTAAGNPYVEGTLKDLSVSRSSFTWGIPVPEPAASAAKDKHVIYVWLDALANYMTAIGYGSSNPADKLEFEKFWPADLHLVGKEIIRFHCVYWPAFLLAADLPLPKAITAHGWLLFDNSKMSKSKGNIVRTETILDAFGTLCPPPVTLPSVTSSKAPDSTGLQPGESATNASGALAPGTPAAVPTQHDRDLFAADVLRYFLLREIPFGQDGSFSFDALITRYNADLANGYGNLVSRTLRLIEQNCDGAIPSAGSVRYTPFSDPIMSWAWETLYIVDYRTYAPAEDQLLGKEQPLDFSRTIALLSGGVALCDSALTHMAPWKLVKDPLQKETVNGFLYEMAESIRIITALLHPILPYATAKVWHQLGLGDIELAARNGELKNLTWGGLKPGTKLGPLAPIFPRADKGLANIMNDLENTDTKTAPESPLKSAFTPTPAEPVTNDRLDPAAPPRTFTTDATQVAGTDSITTREPLASHKDAPASGAYANVAAQTHETAPQITIDDFAKVELRIAQILVAERIPKADKLLRLEVDLGDEKRQILSGIAEFYTPEDLIGRRIIVITNLAPRKMRGLESHGMLLAASEDGGKPFLATVPEGVPVGTRLK